MTEDNLYIESMGECNSYYRENILKDCLGRIYYPIENCRTCKKDELNLRCPHYTPHNQVELIIEPRDEYGDQGASVPKRLDDVLK